MGQNEKYIVKIDFDLSKVRRICQTIQNSNDNPILEDRLLCDDFHYLQRLLGKWNNQVDDLKSFLHRIVNLETLMQRQLTNLETAVYENNSKNQRENFDIFFNKCMIPQVTTVMCLKKSLVNLRAAFLDCTEDLHDDITRYERRVMAEDVETDLIKHQIEYIGNILDEVVDCLMNFYSSLVSFCNIVIDMKDIYDKFQQNTGEVLEPFYYAQLEVKWNQLLEYCKDNI